MCLFLRKFLCAFFCETSLEGVKYLALPNLHIVERVFWTFILIICIAFAGFLFQNLLQTFYTHHVMISFQPKATSIAKIPFGAITICGSVNINQDNEIIPILQRSSTLPRKYSVEGTSKSELTNITQVSHNCEDMILKCVWQSEQIACRDLFFHIQTLDGSCCVFNMMPESILKKIPRDTGRDLNLPDEMISQWKAFSEEDLIAGSHDHGRTTEGHMLKFPAHQKGGGLHYGLSILLNPDLEMFSSRATSEGPRFKILAHSPLSQPRLMEYSKLIPAKSEVFVEIEPEVTTASKRFASVDVDKRGCYFPHDEQSRLATFNFYTLENCLEECVTEQIYRRCACISHFMPDNSTSKKLCNLKELTCVRHDLLMKAKDDCPACKPACTEITYKMTTSHFPLSYPTSKGEEIFAEDETKGKRVTNNSSIVHIFFAEEDFYAKERIPIYSTTDLLSHGGGVLDFILGCSATSILEIMYFFVVKLPVLLISTVMNKKKQTSIDVDRKPTLNIDLTHLSEGTTLNQLAPTS